MQFLRFEIENFKGIEKATVDLKGAPNANIFTLVGLNESGKTTILEAINSFSPDEEGVGSLYKDVSNEIRKTEDYVPKNKESNFTGTITVRAHVKVSEEDRVALQAYCVSMLKAEIDLTKIPDEFSITRTEHYKISERLRPGVSWGIEVYLKKRRQEKFQKRFMTQDYFDVISFLRKRLPTICYFPTFLFNFPKRVYLSNPPPGTALKLNAYYVQIIQDILDSLDDKLEIKTHILDRVEKVATPTTPWSMSTYRQSLHRSHIEALIRKIEAQVTTVVFTRWNEIFGTKIKNKSVVLDCDVEEREEKREDQQVVSKRSVYIDFSIRDGTEAYLISERSLGFRWFFCFLLFTQFRATRKGSSALFLFDEPASNLHSRAQQQLLKSLPSIAVGQNQIIYSTHSHYMIEPRWLEGTFIVSNDAINYDEDAAKEAAKDAVPTNIHIMKYRTFVDKNPSKVSYFQPILDRLDYIPSALERGKSSILLEGKNDFYTLEYFRGAAFAGKHNLHFLPSVSANQLDPLISLYLGWGQRFIILLDDDPAGRSAKERYIAEWILPETQVMTLSDISEKFKKWKLEKLVTPAALKIIQKETKSSSPKKAVARFFQEKCARSEVVSLDEETTSNFEILLDGLQTKLKQFD